MRLIFLSNLGIRKAYPMRMALLFWLTLAFFLVSAYYILSVKYPINVGAFEIVKELFLYAIPLSLILFFITLSYTISASRDYEEVEKFAKELSKGNLNARANLSGMADRDLIEIYQALEKLRKSLILSKELLKNKREK